MTSRELNQLRISQVLDGVAVPVSRAQFGNFGLLRTAADMVWARPEKLPEIAFSTTDDEVIARAFEKLRKGFSVDRLLADPVLTRKFDRLCRKLGVKASDTQTNRRLLALRKKEGGHRLLSTTVRDMQVGLRERFGPAVEYAMLRVSVRYGASVDDILADPEIGHAFENIAKSIIPNGTPVEYRLCALQIRKSRRITDSERLLFDQLNPESLQELWSVSSPLQTISKSQVPDEGGVIEILEGDRSIYISSFYDLKAGAKLFASTDLLRSFAEQNHFWRPDFSAIRLRMASKSILPEHNARLWSLRLIHDHEPLFNWPVQFGSAA